jgi:hypothetical protein
LDKQKIKELYLAGLTIDDIAKELNGNANTIQSHIRNMKRDGELPRGRRKNKLPRKFLSIREMAKTWNEEPVYCTLGISRKCVWGAPETGNPPNLCNYCAIVGHSRGCHWKECHRFIKITERTPRPLIRFDVGLRINGFKNYDR